MHFHFFKTPPIATTNGIARNKVVNYTFLTRKILILLRSTVVNYHSALTCKRLNAFPNKYEFKLNDDDRGTKDCGENIISASAE